MTTASQTTTTPDFSVARKAMIDSQLRTSGVNEAFVLERMGAVAREDFVPEQTRGTAYMDRAIRLPGGGYLPSPVFHGMMLAEARPRVDDTVLIVSNGSDYLEELVRPLVARLDTLPAEAAAGITRRLGPYSLVLVDGAVEHVPAGLAKCVAEGGRM
ncbi:MAG: protein-L-isoaspartate O-methyltransferase family protein, partial [Qipengyuania sp.]